MELFLTLIGSSLVTAIVTFFLTRRKTDTEITANEAKTELTEIEQAKILVTMALEIADQRRQFYEIRIQYLESEVKELKALVERQAQEIEQLRKRG